MRISHESCELKRKKNIYSWTTIILDEKTCIKIIEGKSSILREFNFGNIQISNLKQMYMYRIILLDILIENKKKLEKRSKLIQLLPGSIIRSILQIFLMDKFSGIIKLLINTFSKIITNLLLEKNF